MTDTLKPCPFCGREPRTRMGLTDGEQWTGARCEEHTQWIPVDQWNRRSLDAGAVREATIQECARVAMNPKLFEHYTDGPLALCGGVVDAILALGQINAARKGTTSNFNDTYDQNARRRGQYDDTKDKP